MLRLVVDQAEVLLADVQSILALGCAEGIAGRSGCIGATWLEKLAVAPGGTEGRRAAKELNV